jgi:O-antigen/teichoic acid export membrane protein
VPALAERAAFGAKWSFASVVGRHVVTLVTTLVLARLLTPADFGLLAMAAVFVGFADLVRDMGTGSGIVQAEAPSAELLSSVFWANTAFGVIATAILFALAPLAATLLRTPNLTAVLRALSVSISLDALSVVQIGLLTRELRFRRLALVELAGASAGGALGIVLALDGYAVWSLVWQSVCTALVVAAGTWLASAWRPRLAVNMSAMKPILNFSVNLTGFNVLNYFVRNADSLLIGRYLGAQSLGLYDLAYRIMLYPLQLISWSLGRALFPIYARLRDEPERLGTAYLKVTKAIALTAFPMTLGLVGIADLAVRRVLGPAWAPMVPLLMILCPLAALQAVGTTVGSVYQAMGRTDLLLRWGAAAGVLLIGSFAVGLHWGVMGVAVCYSIVSYALAYHLFKIPLSLIGLRVSDVAEAVGRPLLCAGGMLLVVFLLKRVIASATDGALALGVLVSVGVVVYVSATWMWNRESAFEVLALAKRVS